MASFLEQPQPGDIIEIFHIGYKDWAIYVGDGYVVHLTPRGLPRIGSSNMFMFLSGKAEVTKEPLGRASWGRLYWVNNLLDHKCRPRPVPEIIHSAKEMIGDQRTYAVLLDNSEKFVTDLRYGSPRRLLSSEDPIPGDLIEIFRPVYQHWALYVGDGYVVHVTTTGRFSGSSSSCNGIYDYAEVKCELLKDVAGNDNYTVSNYLDNKYRPRAVDDIVNLARKKIGETRIYDLLLSNCEHFVTELRNERHRSKQGTLGILASGLAAALVML